MTRLSDVYSAELQRVHSDAVFPSQHLLDQHPIWCVLTHAILLAVPEA